jgi:hypothetical protein
VQHHCPLVVPPQLYPFHGPNLRQGMPAMDSRVELAALAALRLLCPS